MKDEIKEILSLLNSSSWSNEAKQIEDYITNLQTIEQQYSAILSENAELENKITNLQKENKQLKDKIKKLKDYGEKVGERRNQLYERIDKATEYINREYWINQHEHNDRVIKELLEILGDKE